MCMQDVQRQKHYLEKPLEKGSLFQKTVEVKQGQLIVLCHGNVSQNVHRKFQGVPQSKPQPAPGTKRTRK